MTPLFEPEKRNLTLTITERERQVMLEALRFLVDLLTRAAPVAGQPASPQAVPGGVESGTIQVNARILKAEKGKTVKGDACMRVLWGTMPEQLGHGRKTDSGTCFNPRYFQLLTDAAQSGQTIKMAVARRGNYLSILSVAA